MINFIGNSGVVAAGGISLGIASHFALQSLGLNGASAVATIVSVSATAIGAAGVVAGVGFLAYAIHGVSESLKRG
ncbi:MAG: hypothetical protein H0X29_03405 [Parachlamydiaceae bacterium]|nr:hypothetical protein [Parachlamydiaceae bacterium]